MISRLTCLFVATVSLACVVTACHGDDVPHGTARFADTDELTRGRAVQSAVGGDALSAVLLARFAGEGVFGDCPVRSVVDGTLVLEGGCTTADGRAVSGRAVLDNVLELDARPYDPAAASRVTFDDLAFTGPDVAIDGTIEVAPGGGDVTTALRLRSAGIAVTRDGGYACDDDGACAPTDGSTVDVEGLGDAVVEGSWSLQGGPDGDGSGTVVLRGDDELRVDLAARDADGCVPLQVDGAPAGHLCDD